MHTYTVKDYSTVSGNLLDERSGLLPEVAYEYARACASHAGRVAHITRDGSQYGIVIIRHDDEERARRHNVKDLKAHTLALLENDQRWGRATEQHVAECPTLAHVAYLVGHPSPLSHWDLVVMVKAAAVAGLVCNVSNEAWWQHYASDACQCDQPEHRDGHTLCPSCVEKGY
jgi:hypothetical protein